MEEFSTLQSGSLRVNIYPLRLEIVNSGVCIDPITSSCLVLSSTEATTEPDTEVGTEAKHGSRHG